MAKIGNVVDAETAWKYAKHPIVKDANLRAVIWPKDKIPMLNSVQSFPHPKRMLCHLLCLEDVILLQYSMPVVQGDCFLWFIIQAIGDYAYVPEFREGDKASYAVIAKDEASKRLLLERPEARRFYKEAMTIDEVLQAKASADRKIIGIIASLATASVLEDFAFSPLATIKLRPTHRHHGNPRKYPLQQQPIEIINLRMPEKVDHPESTGKTINLRFPVQGFIRNQWYPSLGIHKPINIAPHWRGPENAPVKPETKRVYKVTR